MKAILPHIYIDVLVAIICSIFLFSNDSFQVIFVLILFPVLIFIHAIISLVMGIFQKQKSLKQYSIFIILITVIALSFIYVKVQSMSFKIGG